MPIYIDEDLSRDDRIIQKKTREECKLLRAISREANVKTVTPKRRAQLLDTEPDLKRRRMGYFERLIFSISDLIRLTKALPKSRSDIKDCALKLASLAKLAELEAKHEKKNAI